MKNKMLKSNKGITLIALVITIIVIILLSAVVFRLLLGQTGVLNRSREAKFKSNLSSVEERVRMYVNDRQIDNAFNNYSGNISYPVTGNKITSTGEFKDSLIQEIQDITGKSDLSETNIYYIDKNELNLNDLEHDYLLDTDTYQVYDLQGDKFFDKWHHTINSLGQAGGDNPGGGSGGGQSTQPEIITANIKFTTTPSNIQSWYNGDITVTASATLSTSDSYVIKTSKDNVTYTETSSQTFTANGIMYAKVEVNGSVVASSTFEVDKIDKTNPQITSATANNLTITISATDAGSGVKGYAISTSTTIPDASYFITETTSTTNYNKTIEVENENTTYYIWVIDAAGNICNTYSSVTSGAEDPLLASVVSVGDYVSYLPRAANATASSSVSSSLLTYTSPIGTNASRTSGNGYANQTFTAMNNIRWRVLKIENNQVVLINETQIKTNDSNKFQFRTLKSYLYMPNELHNICKIYGYGYGADTSKVTTYKYGDIASGEEIEGSITSGARCLTGSDVGTVNIGSTLNNYYYYPTVNTKTGVSSGPSTVERATTARYFSFNKYASDSTERSLILGGFSDITWIVLPEYQIDLINSNNQINYSIIGLRSTDGYVGSMLTGALYDTKASNGGLSENPHSVGIKALVYLRSDLRTKGKVLDTWALK